MIIRGGWWAVLGGLAHWNGRNGTESNVISISFVFDSIPVITMSPFQ